MLFHPCIDGWIPLDSAIESQQFGSHVGSSFQIFRSQFAMISATCKIPAAELFFPAASVRLRETAITGG
jgi:hypothetical protein